MNKQSIAIYTLLVLGFILIFTIIIIEHFASKCEDDSECLNFCEQDFTFECTHFCVEKNSNGELNQQKCTDATFEDISKFEHEVNFLFKKVKLFFLLIKILFRKQKYY
jgi:hypothetical protein